MADGYKDLGQLCELEIKKIAEYKTRNRDFGYNIAPGGNVNHGFKHTKEWKRMMSKRMSGENSPSFGRKLTKEQKEYLSKINSGELHPRYGKEKSKKEIRAITKGLKKYYESHDSSFKGKRHTKEVKKKISKANSGKNNGMYGKKAWNNGNKNPEWSKKMAGRGNPMFGRMGESHPGAKLNYEKAEEIRKKYKTQKCSYSQLLKEFNISSSQVGNIINNRVWVRENNNE